VAGNVRRRLPVVARGCLLTSLGRAKHDRLVAGGALGGNAARLLKGVPEEVIMYALSWALCVALCPRYPSELGENCTLYVKLEPI
jgi:hypothetical protein